MGAASRGPQAGDIERLSDLHAREAGRAKDPHEAIAHLVRAALVRAGDDADAAAAQLTRALDLMPSDPVLRELVIRLGDAVPATLRAEAIQSSAERAPTALKRPATLAAAAAFEDASQPARALALFEAVLAEHRGDPIAEMGLERVARAAGKAAQLDEEKRRQLADAQDARARRKALEALLEMVPRRPRGAAWLCPQPARARTDTPCCPARDRTAGDGDQRP